ncbi:hypothetical protein CJ030_MR5G003591 [Morella rubra]|uniref:KAT8 regulatory NSL complex subunit 2 n=1 Tax=Morella rubra TaxID=262757 RepID=A0A6A1VKA3_9ROSI|nr:hypothetical protein CJ030_MR5G003591 [Morella rubra]
MASAHRLQNPSSSNSKPPRNPLNPKPTSHAHYQFPYPTTNATAITRCTPTTTTSPAPASQEDVDVALSSSSHLTRHQLLRRRSRHLKQLSKCYRDHYWALMEELKLQYREYYWRYGVSPFKQEQQQPVSDREFEDGNLEGSGENVNNSDNNNVNFDVKCNQRCVFVGCKLKAMPLTSFCHLHILSDSKQKLYKACSYVIKSIDTLISDLDMVQWYGTGKLDVGKARYQKTPLGPNYGWAKIEEQNDVNLAKNNETQQRKGTQDRSRTDSNGRPRPVVYENKNLGIRKTPQTVMKFRLISQVERHGKSR